MPDNNTLIQVSAFSGLAGAILSQTLTGLFAYIGDKRKADIDLKKAYRDKQVEVAENYYYLTVETMTVLKKSIEHWKDKNKPRSEVSIQFFNKEIKKLDSYMDRLKTDNWKHTLIGLYFDVSLSYDELISANNRSHTMYLNLLDIADKFKNAASEDKDILLGKYHLGIFDLCSQYEGIYNLLEKDMINIKTELLRTFQVR